MAFSCGPYGSVLADGSEYNGSYADKVTVEQLMDFHRGRLQVNNSLLPFPEHLMHLASLDLHCRCKCTCTCSAGRDLADDGSYGYSAALPGSV